MKEQGCVTFCCAQLCPAFFNSMDWDPPGSSVQGIFQARILEWTATFVLTEISKYRNPQALLMSK